jgi:hypothetical protein
MEQYTSVSNPRCRGRADRRGFTLEVTLVALVLLTLLLGFAATQLLLTLRTANLDYRSTRAAYAAEGGTDAMLAQLAPAMNDGVITDADLGAVSPPTLSGFTFESMNAQRVGAPLVRPITDGPFAGLYALNQRIDLDLTARDPLNNTSRIILGVNAQSIPIFQFGVFYEKDLEIHNGPPMTFAGWVHTNGNLYLSSANTFFQSLITTPKNVYWERKAYDERLNGVNINDAAGTPVRLTFDSRSVDSAGFVARSDADFDGRLMTSAYGVKPLRLPLPSGMNAIELTRPRVAGDAADLQGVKYAWKADWYITVDAAQLGNICAPGAMAHIRPAGIQLPDAAACALIFQGIPNAFHEGRENIGADVFQIDIAQLSNWAGLNAQRRTLTLYVTFVNSDATTGRDYPVVRLRNGAQLPNPLTVATDRPLYVWGDYNAGAWRPAALAADAITFLSNAWAEGTNPGDAHRWDPAWDPNQDHAFGVTNGAPTAVYAAIAAGHSATPCDWQVSGCVAPAFPPATPNGSYGGGLENFPRFLENWSGQTFTYRGSLVSLFESQYAARKRWSWQSYYSPPNRDWQFELRFQDPVNLPPATPIVGNIAQTSFRTVY